MCATCDILQAKIKAASPDRRAVFERLYADHRKRTCPGASLRDWLAQFAKRPERKGLFE